MTTSNPEKSQLTLQFGFHLTLDLYGCDPAALACMETCYRALAELPGLIGMKPLSPPFVVRSDGTEAKGGIDPGGNTGFIIIEQSHISLHTFVKRGFVSIDVYSCKAFDREAAVTYFQRAFVSNDTEVHFVERGSRYPAQNIY